MPVQRRRNLWGWSVPARRLLAGLALVLSLALAGRGTGQGGTAVEPALAVDPNVAPRAVLLALPRIGPVLAGRIVAGRQERPFRSLADLDARVPGIGPVTAAALRPYLAFPDPPAD